jgi:hypothetical protein
LRRGSDGQHVARSVSAGLHVNEKRIMVIKWLRIESAGHYVDKERITGTIRG